MKSALLLNATKETAAMLSFHLTNDLPTAQHATFNIPTGAIQREPFDQVIMPYCSMDHKMWRY